MFLVKNTMYGSNLTHQNVYTLQKTMYQYNITHQNVYKLKKTMYGYIVTNQIRIVQRSKCQWVVGITHE